LILPALFLLARLNFNKTFVEYGISIAAILFGIHAFLWFQDLYVNKDLPLLYYFSYHRGIASFTSALFALLSLSFISAERKNILNVFFFFAFLSGSFGLLMFSGKGAIISYFLILFGFLFFYKNISKRISLTFLTVMLISIIALISLNKNLPLTHKFVLLSDTYSAVMNDDNSYDNDRSTLNRLRMYKLSIDISRENAIFGIGEGKFRDAIREKIAKGEANDILKNFNHAHNEYLTVLVENGIIGLLILLYLLFLPIKVVIDLKGKIKKYNLAIEFYTIIITSSNYLIYATTNAIFEHQMLVLLYVFIITICVAGISRKLASLN